MKTDVLKITQLKKTFQSGQQQQAVLNGVSFSVHEGEYVAICGPLIAANITLMACWPQT
jgi:putative ABC transport system ATP-binding protein